MKTMKRKYAKTQKKNYNKKHSNNTRKLICSPKNKLDGNKFSCYSNSALLELRNLWNNKYPNNRINLQQPQDIWKQLNINFKDTCNKESCWVKKTFIKDIHNGKISNRLINFFAPEKPTSWNLNKNEWLSDKDINDVVTQYEDAYKCFQFLGPSPIDYCEREGNRYVSNEICKFSLKNMINQGKFKIGIIFNLDPHTKGGSHWVSLFINIKKKTIFYFNSTGETIEPQISQFVENVIQQGLKLSPQIKFTYDENYPLAHQYKNTECGVYSLYFILSMLKDKHSPTFFKSHRITDEQIEKYINIYFNDNL